MLRVLLLAAAAIAAAGCTGESSEPRATEPTDVTRLEIEVWPEGLDGNSRRSALDCESDPELEACRRLSSAPTNLFDPVPPDVACTQIYGGPQVAQVRGTFRGRSISAMFNRTNGCEIDRWDRVRFLFPVRT